MKYVDMVNEEQAFNLVSENERIKCNITVIHPEFIFEDNSMLILPDVETYYNMIGNAEICTPIDQDIDVMKLIMEYATNTDTVTDFSHRSEDVRSIFEIEYEGSIMYYLQRGGISPIVLS